MKWLDDFADRSSDTLVELGDFAVFMRRTLSGIMSRQLSMRLIVPIFYNVGVSSLSVAIVTGVFLGMVLAIEAYAQFHPYKLDSAMGTITCGAILSELGPVLAAVMLAGRVGSSMAAELGTMRVSDQIDALACLGVDPVHYLSTPRFLACLMLIPLLTVISDTAGIFGSVFICVEIYDIDLHQYWSQTLKMIGSWEVMSGLVKSIVFGGVLALISCFRGFRSQAGAEGVGRAATAAFVTSFITIIILDFFLVYFLNNLHTIVYPVRPEGGISVS